MTDRILFYKNQVSFRLERSGLTKTWIYSIVKGDGFLIDQVSVVFTNDSYLLKINKKYLNHNTLTDIITFDFSGGDKNLNGEIYISIDRVKENAATLGLRFSDELRRVIIHGFLHMMGYSDKSSSKKVKMTKKEDACLSLWNVPRGTRNTRAKNRP